MIRKDSNGLLWPHSNDDALASSEASDGAKPAPREGAGDRVEPLVGLQRAEASGSGSGLAGVGAGSAPETAAPDATRLDERSQPAVGLPRAGERESELAAAGTVEATHIRFVPAPPKPKTKIWRVENKYDGGLLGGVGWFGRWRKYSFYPVAETVFEEVCLRDIARFCEEQTRLHKAAAASVQPNKALRGQEPAE